MRKLWAFGFILLTTVLMAQIPPPASKEEAKKYLEAQPGEFQIAQLKYNGGGDWYKGPSSLPNLLAFAAKNAGLVCAKHPATVSLDSPDLWRYRYIFVTGHGNMIFTPDEAQRLRDWLEAGGFIHLCDSYGMDVAIRREMKKVFPDQDIKEVPADFAIYKTPFPFPDGRPPKVHVHDGKPAQGFGWWINGRLVAYYDYQCDLGDGWEDPDVHNDPEPVRTAALKMGTNLIVYALTH